MRWQLLHSFEAVLFGSVQMADCRLGSSSCLMSSSAGTLCVVGQVRLMGIRPDIFGATAEVAAQQLYRVALEGWQWLPAGLAVPLTKLAPELLL